jgi:hypothetical protein
MTERFINMLIKLVEQGKLNIAISRFLNNYVLPSSFAYQTAIQKILNKTDNRVLTAPEFGKLSISVSSKTVAFGVELRSYMTDFIKKVLSKPLFKKLDITSPAVKQAITHNAIQNFNKRIVGALSETNTTILKSMRGMQKDLLIIDKKVEGLIERGLPRDEINKLKSSFFKDLKKNNKEFYRLLDEDKFVIYRDGSMHKYDDYMEMAARTTILNVDRDAVEIKEAVEGNRVVEYYVRDKRAAKTSRSICRHVLSRKLFNKSLVATDQRAASQLNIPYIGSIREQGAMGVNCRHSIRNVGETVINQIDKILYLSEAEVG